MTLDSVETGSKPLPITEVDEGVFDIVDDLCFDEESIARYSSRRLSDSELASTTIIARASRPISVELRRQILGIYSGGCIELFIPNILDIDRPRLASNPNWLTSPRNWDHLSSSEKCSAVLAHELEHRFEDVEKDGTDWEAWFAEENLRKKANCTTTGIGALVGTAATASFEVFNIGINAVSVGVFALAIGGVVFAGPRADTLIKRRGYYAFPNEVRANQAAITNTEQFVCVQDLDS